MRLSKNLFWDVDYNSISWDEGARFVIERVVMYGTMEDWRSILDYYGRDRVCEEMLQSRELDPKSMSFLSCIFDTPPEKFRCFKQIQSSRAHWTY